MKIASAQIKCQPGEVQLNLEKVYTFAKQAKSAGCDLVLFPELVDTGYDPGKIKASASFWQEAPFQKLSQIAKGLKLNLVSGLSEKCNDKLYNSVAVFNRNGELLTSYRKTHLITTEPICEDHLFTPGNSFTTFNLEGLDFGIMVCYDLRFPEMARNLALKGVHVILVPSAWPLSRLEHLKTLVTCRAIENQIYLVTANRVGKDGEFEFGGNSCIINPWGDAPGFASKIEEALLIAEIDLNKLKEIREFMPVFKQRRENLYCK